MTAPEDPVLAAPRAGRPVAAWGTRSPVSVVVGDAVHRWTWLQGVQVYTLRKFVVDNAFSGGAGRVPRPRAY
ncbi:MAG: hypothetical protein J0I40_14140 [Cellulomonas sp.]|nr:hypothetical protein [Cellulomonas sp.]